MSTHYEILGVNKDASLQEIKKAYRSLALKHHPDKNIQNDDDSDELFTKISEAYDILSDSTKRKNYDLNLQFGGQHMQSDMFGSDIDPFHIFQQVFGNEFGNGMPDVSNIREVHSFQTNMPGFSTIHVMQSNNSNNPNDMINNLMNMNNHEHGNIHGHDIFSMFDDFLKNQTNSMHSPRSSQSNNLDSDSEPDSEPESKPKSDSKFEPKSKPDLKSKSEPEPEPNIKLENNEYNIMIKLSDILNKKLKRITFKRKIYKDNDFSVEEDKIIIHTHEKTQIFKEKGDTYNNKKADLIVHINDYPDKNFKRISICNLYSETAISLNDLYNGISCTEYLNGDIIYFNFNKSKIIGHDKASYFVCIKGLGLPSYKSVGDWYIKLNIIFPLNRNTAIKELKNIKKYNLKDNIDKYYDADVVYTIDLS